MATVTAFTASRSLAIENKRVDSAAIVGDDLILTRKDGTTLNAGNVRGPQGDQGIQGVPGPSLPSGAIIAGPWESDPSGYLILDGRTLTAATYPNVAAAYPSWVSGGNLVLPNMTGAVLMGAASAGVLSGSMSHTLTVNNLPVHVHSGPSHRHTGPSHRHSIAHGHNHTFAVGGGNHAHPAGGYELNSNNAIGKFYTYVGNSGSNYHWADPGVGNRTQWAAYTNPPTTNTNANVTFSGAVTSAPVGTYSAYDGTGVTGYEGTGDTGPAGAGTSINHTPRNLSVKFAVKT
jgi:hypothetical protein